MTSIRALRERDDAELLLYAMMRGAARWEWLPSGKSGEVCCGGMRYCCPLNERGVPVLTGLERRALNAALAQRESK